MWISWVGRSTSLQAAWIATDFWAIFTAVECFQLEPNYKSNVKLQRRECTKILSEKWIFCFTISSIYSIAFPSSTFLCLLTLQSCQLALITHVSFIIVHTLIHFALCIIVHTFIHLLTCIIAHILKHLLSCIILHTLIHILSCIIQSLFFAHCVCQMQCTCTWP